MEPISKLASTLPTKARPRRILLVCQVFYPDAQSTSQLLTDLLQRLSKEPTLQLTVLCGYPSALRVEGRPIGRRELWERVEIIRCGWRVDVKRSMAHRLASYLSFTGHVTLKLLFMRGQDMVFGVTNPPFLGIVLWMTSRLRRFPYQYNVQDMYPEGLVGTGTLGPKSAITRIWRFFNRRVYRRADRVVVLGRDMAARLAEDYGVPPEKLTVIPHWSLADPSESGVFSNNTLARELGLLDSFVIQYSGNMGLWHDMEIFVRAASRLRDIPKMRFLFIGGGRRRAAAEQLAKELGADNITWLDFVPRERLAESLACCHVSLVSMRTGLQGIAVPCKIYGILASGRAMLAQVPLDSEVSLVVREEDCGVVVPPGDLEALVEMLRRLMQDPEKVHAMGRRGFNAYQRKYRVQHAEAAFRDLWGVGVTTRQTGSPDPAILNVAPL